MPLTRGNCDNFQDNKIYKRRQCRKMFENDRKISLSVQVVKRNLEIFMYFTLAAYLIYKS